MWNFKPTSEFGRRFKRYEKNRPRELEAVLDNLGVVQENLLQGGNPQKLPYGFIHIEPRGVVAIDQKGGGKSLAETRLYVYLDRDEQIIHLITLGDKTTQKADVKTSSDYVEGLNRQKRGSDHGRRKDQKRDGAGEEPGREPGVR